MTTMGEQPTSSLWKRKGTSIVGLLWILASCPLFSRATAVPPKPPSLVADWIRAKGCGRRGDGQQQQQQLWMYQGALYDPLDGRKIANVQGLELVSTIRSNNQTNHHPEDLLKMHSLLQDPNATYEDAATLWSQNIFCYTTSNNNNKNNHTLLREIRVRPQSPRKVIPLNQAVALYETATTLICRDDDKDDTAMVHSEFLVPKQGESSLWSPVTTRKHDDSTLEWTVYAKRRSPKSRLYLPDLLTTTKKRSSSMNVNTNSSSHEDDDSAIPIISPERSALIQFGSSNMESKHKFGARETYSWNLPKAAPPEVVQKWFWQRRPNQRSTNEETSSSSSSLRLQYTRYGEGPPFYAPGRMCMLELQARPIDDLEEATPILQDLIQHRVRGWGNSGGGGASLQLLSNDDNFGATTQWAKRQGQAMALWERLRAATTVQQEASSTGTMGGVLQD
jgi:hypothetical protein